MGSAQPIENAGFGKGNGDYPLDTGTRLRYACARLYRLALEKHEAGARCHSVAEEGVPVRTIAEVLGRGLKAPVVAMSSEEAAAHFGWLAMFAGLDMPARARKRRKSSDGARLALD
jgi:hypothetical protein